MKKGKKKVKKDSASSAFKEIYFNSFVKEFQSYQEDLRIREQQILEHKKKMIDTFESTTIEILEKLESEYLIRQDIFFVPSISTDYSIKIGEIIDAHIKKLLYNKKLKGLLDDSGD